MTDPTPAPDQCNNCVYGLFTSAHIPKRGYCVRFPPVPVGSSDGDMETQWPRVFVTEWCGEFKKE